MLSTVSGIYFAGHRPPAITGTPPTSPIVPSTSEINFKFPGSGTTGSTTLVNMTGTTAYNASVPSGMTVSLTPTPAYATLNGSSQAVIIPSSATITPSNTHQGTATVWVYVPSASVVANGSAGFFSYYDVMGSFDGVFMFAVADFVKRIQLRVTTNGGSNNNTQAVPTSNYLPQDQWFMLTYVYIMNNTAPSSVWYNDTLVHTWTHTNDSMATFNYQLFFEAFNLWKGRFNNFMILDNGLTQAEVTSKFTAERSYYGV